MTPIRKLTVKLISAVLVTLMLAALLPMAALADRAALRESRAEESLDEARTGDPRAQAVGLYPPATDDFNNITVLITIGKRHNKVNTIQLKLVGDYYFESNMHCICDTTNDPYTLNIVNSNGIVYAYDYAGNLLTSGTELRLNKVYIGREAGYAILYTTGCDLQSYPFGTNNFYYLGNFIFDAKDHDQDDGLYYLRMRNVVPLEYYVYGVIEHEMSATNKPAALRAQAIAAKSFGLSFRGYYTDYDVMDGYSDGMNQLYRGFTQTPERLPMLEHASFVVGKALAYNGRIVTTNYGATNGGETTLPSMAFGYSTIDDAYAVTLDEPDFISSPTYRREADIKYGSQTGANGENASRFRDFILAKARAILGGSYNRVTEITNVEVFDPLAGTTLDMQRLRFTAKVVDTNYTPPPVPTPDPDDPDATPAPTQDPTPVPVEFTCTCPAKDLKELRLYDYDGSGDTYDSVQPGVFYANYLMYRGEQTANGYKIYFCRYGHGVGLSQHGAAAWAKPEYGGKSCEEILRFYFPGFTLVDINESDADAPFASTLPTVAYGHCTGAYINVRTAPSLTDSEIIGVAQSGDHLDIVSIAEGGYFYLVLWNGHMGYISHKFTQIDMFPSPADAQFTVYTGVCMGRVPLYNAPTTYAGYNSVLNDSEVTIWTSIGKWYYVITEKGSAGYLPKSSVTITGSYQHNGSEPIPNAAPRPNYLFANGRETAKPGSGGRRLG